MSKNTMIVAAFGLPRGESRPIALLYRAGAPGRAGDQARSELVKEHYSWILKRCEQTLGNPDDARDAAQEVALSMYKSLRSYEGRSSLRTWLNTIVHNECVSFIRRQQKHAMTSQITSLITIFEESQRGPETPDPESQQLVQKALVTLQPEHREVLQLRFYAELPIAEIGTLLGVGLSAAKMRLYRALDALKAALCEIDQPSEPILLSIERPGRQIA